MAGLASTLITRRHDARRVRGVHTTRYHAEPAASVRHSDRYSKDQKTQHRPTVNPRRRDAARDGEEAHRRGDLPDDIVHGACRRDDSSRHPQRIADSRQRPHRGILGRQSVINANHFDWAATFLWHPWSIPESKPSRGTGGGRPFPLARLRGDPIFLFHES